MDYSKITSPAYVIDEELLRRNLEILSDVSARAKVEIILALKAFANWGVFSIIKEYFGQTTASSYNEAMLANDMMGSLAHTYAPIYTAEEFQIIANMSSYLTFNSLRQYGKFEDKIRTHQPKISCGLRINPEVSVVETDLYNPAVAGSRLGIIAENMPQKLPDLIEGLHFHVLCESSSYDLEKVLTFVEEKFGKYFSQIKWLNMGGGHLITSKNYDVEHLILLLTNFKSKYPHLKIILEPGAAFVWQTGVLVATVEDIVENHGIKTAMLDVSFACHMPDCLEMPYQPEIEGAEIVKKQNDANNDIYDGKYIYRMGGNSCLSGDYVGDWAFEKPLSEGDKIVFKDMIHYTTVKTTMFNGVNHPSIGLWTTNNDYQILKVFSYSDYRNRLGDSTGTF